MRRILFGSLVLLAVMGLMLTTGCQRERSLRIVNLSGTGSLFGDVTDFGVYQDPEDPEAEPEVISAIPTDFAEIELQYVELGMGLPAWTPYQAHMDKVTLTYTDITPDESPADWSGTRVVFYKKMSLAADIEGKTTVTYTIPVLDASFKEEHFEEAGSPLEGDVQAWIRVTVHLEGIDVTSGKELETENEMTIRVGNYWDEPGRIGQ